MHPEDLSPDCGRIRGELAGLVYGELAPETRAAVEQHLAGCGACRDELTALRDTHRLLARWETPPAGEDPRALARAIAGEARGVRPRAAQRGRWVRWSAMLSGAAAAVLFTLSLLNARAAVADGRFELSFGLPGASTSPAAAPQDWREEMRAVASEVTAREFSARATSFQQSQQELLRRCTQMTKEELQAELLRLSQAVDYALAQHQENWDTRLTSLGREAARADLETRRVITDLASYLPVSDR
jgi:anti-sigma factor RsiW